MNSLLPYIPASSQGSVLLTSQRRDMFIPSSLELEVAPFDSDSGARLLNSLMQSEDSSDSAREVADLLDGYPLAISQAARNMEVTSTTCSEFLEIYKRRQLGYSGNFDTWKFSGTFGTGVHSIYSALETSLASLSSDARRLLECMAIMDPDQIPEELFLQDIEDVIIVQKYVSSSTSRSPSY